MTSHHSEQSIIREFHRLTAHLAERLQDGQKWKAASLNNLATFLANAQPGKTALLLDSLAGQARELLADITAADVRGAPALRHELAQAFASIAQHLESLKIERSENVRIPESQG